MLISVVIPIYNVEAYLDRCLESIQVQDHVDIEVIGIDDVSSDGSRQIFEQYLDDSRFELLTHTANLGLPSARNTGLLRARGDYIYFLDSDDWVAADCLSKLLAIAREDGSEITIGGTLRYYESNQCYAVPDNHGHLMRNPVRASTVFERPEPYFSTTSWNKLISLDYLKTTGLLFNSIPRRFEDLLTYKWYLSGARISSTPDVTYYYRQRDADSAEASIMQAQGLDVYTDKLIGFADLVRFLKAAGLFRTRYDPLDSPNSMIKLPNFLRWFRRQTFEENRAVCVDPSNQDDFLAMMLACKQLLEEFSDQDAESLPKDIQDFRRLLLTNPILKAANHLLGPGERLGVIG
jgi:glycosyltransferase involved in cell wall biosynthesis